MIRTYFVYKKRTKHNLIRRHTAFERAPQVFRLLQELHDSYTAGFFLTAAGNARDGSPRSVAVHHEKEDFVVAAVFAGEMQQAVLCAATSAALAAATWAAGTLVRVFET